MQLEIEQTALRKEKDEASTRAPARRSSASWPSCSEQLGGLKAQWQQREGGDRRGSASSRSGSSRRSVEAERAEREADLAARGRAALRRASPSSSKRARSQPRASALEALQEDRRDAQGGGRRGGHRRGRRASGPASRSARLLEGEMREAAPHGGAPARARRRPGRGGRGGRQRVRRSRAGLQDPEPPDRLVPLPRPHRRRQDRAGARAGRVPVRRRARRWSASTCASTWRSTPSRG